MKTKEYFIFNAIKAFFSLYLFIYLWSLMKYALINYLIPRYVLRKSLLDNKIHPTVLIRHPWNIELGKNILINHGGVLQAGKTSSKIIIGDNVHMGPYVSIFAYNHGMNPSFPTKLQDDKEETIIIGDDVWVGSQSVLLAGSKIANGCVIGANSLVTGNLDEAYGIYVGSPAKLIGNRFK